MIPGPHRLLASRVMLAPRPPSALLATRATEHFYSSSSHNSSSGGKPPNVLVYSADDGAAFAGARAALRRVLDPDGSLVYRLGEDDALKGHWADGARALVLLRSPRSKQVVQRVAQFAEKTSSGGVLLWMERADEAVQTMKGFGLAVCDAESEEALAGQIAVYRRRPEDSEDAILCKICRRLGLPLKSADAATMLRRTPGYLVCREEDIRRELLAKRSVTLRPVHLSSSDKTMTVRFVEDLAKCDNDKEDETTVLISGDDGASPGFAVNEYFSNLTTHDLGRLLIHVPVMNTGFDLLGEDDEATYGRLRSVAVIPDRQLSGRGRGGNAWISPEGCAMFCLQLSASRESALGRRAPVLCHLVSLAVARAVGICLKRRGAELDVRIKWPNDIYLGNDKIGGVLIYNRCTADGRMLFSVGVGLNLDNALPTASVNGKLRENGFGDDVIGREEYLAEAFNGLELVLSQYQAGREEAVLEQYYKLWLHTDQPVRVRTEEGAEELEATVEGVDEFGFLVVRDANGRKSTVHPDGNSFDIMKGLIFPKGNR